jgi:hypothetical protein
LLLNSLKGDIGSEQEKLRENVWYEKINCQRIIYSRDVKLNLRDCRRYFSALRPKSRALCDLSAMQFCKKSALPRNWSTAVNYRLVSTRNLAMNAPRELRAVPRSDVILSHRKAELVDDQCVDQSMMQRAGKGAGFRLAKFRGQAFAHFKGSGSEQSRIADHIVGLLFQTAPRHGGVSLNGQMHRRRLLKRSRPPDRAGPLLCRGYSRSGAAREQGTTALVRPPSHLKRRQGPP